MLIAIDHRYGRAPVPLARNQPVAIAVVDGGVDVVAAAKKDLRAGEVLDGLGCYMTYGLAENAGVVSNEQLLPIGLAEGCKLKRDISKDEMISYADVILPEARLCDMLRSKQNENFWLSSDQDMNTDIKTKYGV
jgi:predicted homoserine dehydrogenase-like protein